MKRQTKMGIRVAIIALGGLLASLGGVVAYAQEGENQVDGTVSEVIDMTAPIVETIGRIEFRTCLVTAQGRDREVQCAWYKVPENPAQPDGKKIKLFVVRLPAKRKTDKITDPVLFVAGGPGQAASASYLFADQVWQELAKYRDFYLIDQRGTGKSNYMGCSEIMEGLDYTRTDLSSEEIRALTKKCLAVLPGDPRYYTTDTSVKDFDTVREALGIDKWNLYGVSYGTRVSTHYMRIFPQSLRTVVLDSVVPPQQVLGSQIALNSQHMLDKLFMRCEEAVVCNEAMPELRKKVKELFLKLEAGPIEVRVENFSTGEVETQNFSREHLLGVVRMYLYSPISASVLPPMLYEAAMKNNFGPIVRTATRVNETLEELISPGLHNSVMCTEEYPFYQEISQDLLDKNAQSYMGSLLIDLMSDICGVWPKGHYPEKMKLPLESEVPTLLLSGEYDPITPPEFAEVTKNSLKNAKHLELKGQGHFVGGTGCVPKLINQFVSNAGFEELNTQCLDRVGESPLFINFNGPTP